MDSNYEKYAGERIKIQAELNSLPRIQNNGKLFEKTIKEHEEVKKFKHNYKSSMIGLYGSNWKKLSRMIGFLNVPSDIDKRKIVQAEAERRRKNIR